MIDLLTKALVSKRESRQIEFKQSFDSTSDADWCEIIKDIVAITNSRGGVILIGVDSVGKPTETDISSALSLDPAVIGDKLHAYTGIHFSDFELSPEVKESKTILAISIDASHVPIVFTRPGTYLKPDRKQACAFSQGTVYFRHGAKSEPGSTEDLRKAFEGRLEEVRKEWQKGVRKVVTAPAGSTVEIVQSVVPTDSPIRIVEDESAPGFRLAFPDRTHPYRQIDVLQALKSRVRALDHLTSYDIFVVRKLYLIDEKKKYFYWHKFGSPQYSEAFVQFLIDSHSADPDFFSKARTQYKTRRRT